VAEQVTQLIRGVVQVRRSPLIFVSAFMKPSLLYAIALYFCFILFSIMSFCHLCHRSYASERLLAEHGRRTHRFRQPRAPASIFRYHPGLMGAFILPLSSHHHTHPIYSTAECLGQDGVPVQEGAPPPPRDNTCTWAPFPSRQHFRFVEVIYERGQMAAGVINDLLEVWTADKIATRTGEDALFKNAEDAYACIDRIREGACPWYTYAFRWSGPVDATSKAWKHETWLLHTRHALDVAELIAGNTDFDGKWDYVPYQDYTS
jgi:hypothetical protein